MRIEPNAAAVSKSTRIRRTLLVALSVLALSSCGGGGEDEVNCLYSAPRITSSPTTVATAGYQYAYPVNATYNCWVSASLIPVVCRNVIGLQLPTGASASGTNVSWNVPANQANTDVNFAISTPPDVCGNRATQSWTVHVHAPPVIESFGAERTYIVRGESTMLTGVFHGSGQIEGLGPITSGVPVATPALNANTGFTLIVTNSVGAAVSQPFSIEVFDSLSGNGTGPKVIFTNPVNGATGVATNAAFTAIFSENMDAESITPATFVLKNGGNNPVSGTVTYSGQIATFAPANTLGYLTSYTATITDGVKDRGGNFMAANYAWSFTTGPAPDTTPPAVTSTFPANGADRVALEDIRLLVTFSESIDPNSVNSSTFSLKDDSQNPVNGTVRLTNGGKTAEFLPSAALAPMSSYRAIVTTGIKDMAGNMIGPLSPKSPLGR
jgi:hypothetical protein